MNPPGHFASRGLASIIASITALFACGGGGSGGGTGTDLHLSSSSVAFQALASDPVDDTVNVQIAWSNARVAGIVIGTLPGQTLPGWLSVTAHGDASPVTMVLRRVPNGNAAGHYSMTIRVVSGDANLKVIDIVDLPVSFEVVAMPTVAPGSLNLSWVESQRPANQQLSITRDDRVQVVATVVDVDWLGLLGSGSTVTVTGNAQSQLQTPGPYTANLTATFALNGRQRAVIVPITATVGHALNGPSQIATEVNASTLLADLGNVGATITAATPVALQFNASSDVPWLTVSGGTTGPVNNLSLALQSTALRSMANGIYPATVTLTAPNVSALQIPVSLNLRLPEVRFVAPVAFSDTAVTDTVIVRGAGFDDPAAAVQLAGVALSGVIPVSDTEFRFVPGARAAGTYEVKVANRLDFNRGTANLRVIDPPAYANFSMPAAVGLQERIVSSPANAMVFSQQCHFCTVTPAGTGSTVQRFTYDSGTTTWTRTEHPYAKLFDIALSPDESTLLVLTETQLLLVDPQGMTTSRTVDLPAPVSGQSRQLAVMNDGLVIIQALGKAYSLGTGDFVAVPGLISDGGISASRDGSRAIFGEPSNNHDVAYRFYDASTGTVAISATFEHYSRGAYSRHAEKALVNNLLVDGNLSVLGSLPISSSAGDLRADGNRVYGLDFSVSPFPLRVFDVSGASPFVELAPVDLGLDTIARVATDPRGNAVFVISETKFFVIDVR